MDGLVAAQVFGGAAAVLSVGLNVPQVWTSCRHRQVQGLSAVGRWLVLVQSVTWLVYGAVAGVPLQLATNAVCATLQAAVLAALLLLSPAARRPWAVVPQATVAAACLAAVTACATDTARLGLLAAALGGVSTLPQLLLLVRRPAGGTAGISRVSTSLALLSSLCWSAYGALSGRPEVVAPSLLGVAVAAATLLLLRPAAQAPAPALPRIVDLVPRPRSAAAGARAVPALAS